MKENGESIEEIVECLEDNKRKIIDSILIDDLNWCQHKVVETLSRIR